MRVEQTLSGSSIRTCRNYIVGIMIIHGMTFLGSLSAGQTVSFDSLLQEMMDRDRIADHPAGRMNFDLLQVSTHDTRQSTIGRPSTFTNRDFVEGADFLTKPLYGVGVSGTERVFMSANGPGALTRLWIGGNPQAATYRFYVDGNPAPVLQGIGSDLIGNNAATFGSQLSFERGDEFFDGVNIRPGGMNLYAPIPYAENLTITVDSGNPSSVAGQWFVANIRKYRPGTSVQSLSSSTPAASAHLSTTNAALAERTGQLGHIGTTHTDSRQLGVGQSMAHSISGTGAIRELEVKLDVSPNGDLESALRNTYVELTFDGKRTAQVPVGHFFGNGFNGSPLNDDPSRNLNPFNDWWRTVKGDGTMIARWPMPFATDAEVKIVNRSGQDVQVDVSVASGGWEWSDDSMHFHADFREEQDIISRGRGRAGTDRLGPDTDATADWRFVTLRGRGVYVGDTLSILNPRLGSGTVDSVWWGEGDEKIYVDYLDQNGNGHDASPTHAGTGTEDYYGYAWAARGEFDSPFVAQPLADGNSNFSGQTVNSRVRILDTIPFDDSFKFDMEIWHGSDASGFAMDYAAATYWYGRPGAKSLEVAADLGVDFVRSTPGSAGGFADSSGDGFWQLLSSSASNPSASGAVLTALTFGSVGDAGNVGYGGRDSGPLKYPAIADSYITTSGAANIGIRNEERPGYHEIAFHPSDQSDREFAVARWVASERVAGLVNVNGAIRNLIEAGDSIDFAIYVNGALQFSAEGETGGSALLPETNFDFDVAVAAGDTIDFVVGNGGNNSLLGDESLLRAVILADFDPFLVDLLGDLNGDQVIDVEDWTQFRRGHYRPMDALGVSQRYELGDLDLDGDNDTDDFLLFRDAYLQANGPASFARLFHRVPEPAPAAILGSVVALVLVGRGFRQRQPRRAVGQTEERSFRGSDGCY
jgi:hypothetical protein